MKYIMKYENQILLKNGKWVSIGVFEKEALIDNPTERTVNDAVTHFEDFQRLAENFYGLTNSKTIFGKPCVKVCYGLGCEEKITRRRFEALGGIIQIRRVYTSFRPTMEWLFENLPADDFAEYAKDRGWNIIIGK